MKSSTIMNYKLCKYDTLLVIAHGGFDKKEVRRWEEGNEGILA